MVDSISAAICTASRTFQGLIHKLLRRVDLGYVLLRSVQLCVQIEGHQLLKALLSQLVVARAACRTSSILATHILQSPLVLLLDGVICAVMVFVSALGGCMDPLMKHLLVKSFFTMEYGVFYSFGEG